jgi:hypothetical protein
MIMVPAVVPPRQSGQNGQARPGVKAGRAIVDGNESVNGTAITHSGARVSVMKRIGQETGDVRAAGEVDER